MSRRDEIADRIIDELLGLSPAPKKEPAIERRLGIEFLEAAE